MHDSPFTTFHRSGSRDPEEQPSHSELEPRQDPRSIKVSARRTLQAATTCPTSRPSVLAPIDRVEPTLPAAFGGGPCIAAPESRSKDEMLHLARQSFAFALNLRNQGSCVKNGDYSRFSIPAKPAADEAADKLSQSGRMEHPGGSQEEFTQRRGQAHQGGREEE